MFQFLTDSEVQTSKHRSIPALFQTLFDCKVLATVPSVHFLPWTHPPVSKKVNLVSWIDYKYEDYVLLEMRNTDKVPLQISERGST